MKASAFLVGLSFAALPCALAAQEDVLVPPAEICEGAAGWVDDDPDATAREFETGFEAFDTAFEAFAQDFARAYSGVDAEPDAAEIARLHAKGVDAFGALERLIPLRDAGNEVWPMKFLLEDIPRGVPLPQFDPPDRMEVLRAAFTRELARTGLAGPKPSTVTFLAHFELALVYLDSEDLGATDHGTLGVLAGGLLAEAYEAGFRRPALRVLEDGWHTSLASRLRQQVRVMCREAG